MNKIHPLPPPPPYDYVSSLDNYNNNNKIVPVAEIKNHFSLTYDVKMNEIIINVKDMLKNIDYILVINDNNENWLKIKNLFNNHFINLVNFMNILLFYDNYNINYNIQNNLIMIINKYKIILDFILLKDHICQLKEKEIDDIINEFIEEENL
jgi:hypothetical protein